MGRAKKNSEHNETQRYIAKSIACEAGCIEECKYHEGTFVDLLSDPADAFRLGNSKFTRGELDRVFRTRKEMTDEIKAAIKDAADECYACARMFGPS